MEPEEPVTLISLDERDFEIEYERTIWKIPAKTTVYWPWKVACHLLGNPYLQSDTSFDHRSYDRERVMQAHGVPLPDSITFEQWDEMRPKIEVKLMSGEPVRMLSEIPKDENVEVVTGMTSSDMKERIKELERTISNLAANIQGETPFVVTETSANDSAVSTIDEIPEDKGGPRRGRKTAS